LDPFALVLFGGLGMFVLAVWLLGRYYPGSGMDQLGLRTARQITETREALEAEDLEQMVAARNARRRARGEPEVSVGELEAEVLAERARVRAEEERRRERAAAERDLDELLALSNARRRARGLPERTREEAMEEFGGGARPPE
jgi:transcription initiation factor TFIIIB Brf1 subunit/transcription initiation factor TFIIB